MIVCFALEHLKNGTAEFSQRDLEVSSHVTLFLLLYLLLYYTKAQVTELLLKFK